MADLWDAHAHVIGDEDRYPLFPGRSYDPPPAPLEDYLDLLDRLGVHRGVLVQPSVYGHDHRCLLDALERADGRLVGVAVPDPASGERELRALHGRGIRAVRCNLLNPGGLGAGTVLRWQPVMRDLGWHVEIHAAVADLDLEAWIRRFTVPVVVDHMGRPGSDGLDPDSPGLRSLVELVRDDACHVKLSAPYRLSNGPAPWPDIYPLARAFLAANAARCLWATDWPHTDTQPQVHTDDLLEALDEWCPDASEREALMARAGALYG